MWPILRFKVTQLKKWTVIPAFYFLIVKVIVGFRQNCWFRIFQITESPVFWNCGKTVLKIFKIFCIAIFYRANQVRSSHWFCHGVRARTPLRGQNRLALVFRDNFVTTMFINCRIKATHYSILPEPAKLPKFHMLPIFLNIICCHIHLDA